MIPIFDTSKIQVTLVDPNNPTIYEPDKTLYNNGSMDFDTAFAVPNKITLDEYLKLDLELPRRRTGQHPEADGTIYMYMKCYSCKEGYSFDRENVIDGVWGCSESCCDI